MDAASSKTWSVPNEPDLGTSQLSDVGSQAEFPSFSFDATLTLHPNLSEALGESALDDGSQLEHCQPETLVGRQVCIVGLQDKPELNGLSGIVDAENLLLGAVWVRLSSDTAAPRNIVEIGRVNIEVLPPSSVWDMGHDEELFVRSSRAAQALLWYSRYIKKYPWRFIFAYGFLLIIFTVCLWPGFELETDLSGFSKADGQNMRNFDAYSKARKEQQSLISRRLQSDEMFDLYHRREISIFYESKSGNVLDMNVLRQAHRLENRLRQLPGWSKWCQKAAGESSWQCDPGFSLPSRYFPSVVTSGKEFQLSFDGRGPETPILPLSALLGFLNDRSGSGDSSSDLKHFLPTEFSFESISLSYSGALDDVGGSSNKTKGFLEAFGEVSQSAPVLKSIFEFNIAYASSAWPTTEMRKASAREKAGYKSFIATEVYPLLAEAHRESMRSSSGDFKEQPARVYFSGHEIAKIEANTELLQDIALAAGSMAYVTLCIALYVRSPILTVGSFFIIFASVPMAFVCTPADKTTFASLMSIFLITVIDIDIIYIFMEFWEQTSSWHRLEAKLACLLLRAGKSCLATSITTSVSFFANLASALQPLREFGFFMGLCVTNVYVLAMLFFPPLLAIRDRYSSRHHRVLDSGNALIRTETKRRPSRCSAERLMPCLLECIAARPCALLLLSIVFAICCAALVAVSFSLDVGTPQIFPEEHNQIKAISLSKLFSGPPRDPWMYGPLRSGVACDALKDAKECILHWCDSEPVVHPVCWHSPTMRDVSYGVDRVHWGIHNCSSVDIQARFASEQALDDSALNRAFGSLLIDLTNVTSNNDPLFSKMAPLALEDWDAGSVSLNRFVSSEKVSVQLEGSKLQTQAQCSIDIKCYFGKSACRDETLNWRKFNANVLPSLSVPRRLVLVESTIAEHLQIGVNIVYGIRPTRSTPLLGAPTEVSDFDSSFVPQNPWAQRSMVDMCSDFDYDMWAVEKYCWVLEFKNWLQVENRRFPSRDFDSDLVDWYRANEVWGREYTWMVEGKMKACSLVIFVDFNRRSPAFEIIEYKKKWDKWVASKNSKASLSANRAFHTSSSWSKAEVQMEVVGSTASTIAIEYCLSFSGIFIFTGGSFMLAFQVMFLVLGSVLGLAFVMVVVMGWTIGPIEIIFLVIFLGYSVTFGLHLTHNYSQVPQDDPELLTLAASLSQPRPRQRSSICCCCYLRRQQKEKPAEEPADSEDHQQIAIMDDFQTSFQDEQSSLSQEAVASSAAQLRRARTQIAVVKVGGAVMSSALSTVGSAVFLLFCTTEVFFKLGIVIISVMLLSITLTLVVLPAMLFKWGPIHGPCWRIVLRKLLSNCSKRHGSADTSDYAASQESYAASQESYQMSEPELLT